MSRFFAGLFSLIAVAALNNAASAADASKGQTLAKRWCAACHIVSSEQSRGSAAAPPFSAVAKRSGFSEANLAFFLLAPHPKMPDMNLARAEAADLAAYIATQGR